MGLPDDTFLTFSEKFTSSTAESHALDTQCFKSVLKQTWKIDVEEAKCEQHFGTGTSTELI